MVGKLHLFVAACVLAFAFVSKVYGQSDCTPATWGNNTGIPHKLPLLHLPPPNREWQVTIQNPCFGSPNGMVAAACDFDRPPVAEFVNHYVLYVKRTGNLIGVATVGIVVFCQQITAFGVPLESVPRAQPILQTNRAKFID